jgi:hypothetical protein
MREGYKKFQDFYAGLNRKAENKGVKTQKELDFEEG